MADIDDMTREIFPPETLQALFDAVEINDVVDPEVSLPEPISLACTQAEMRRCYALCLQFWTEGADREAMLQLVKILMAGGELDEAQRKQYKYIRARYKHLRFAQMLYTSNHRVPLLYDATVAVMGQLQDAFRFGHRKMVLGHGLLLRILLSPPIWAYVKRVVNRRQLASAENFLAYRKAGIKGLDAKLQAELFTGHQFHGIRKVISRHVSFYVTRQALDPNDHDHKLFRFLSAINGLMGSRHDVMVEQSISGEQKYSSKIPLTDDLRQRLDQFVARYPF